MLYVLVAVVAASFGMVVAAIFVASRENDLLADLTIERNSRLAIESELIDLQGRAYVRNARGQMERMVKS